MNGNFNKITTSLTAALLALVLSPNSYALSWIEKNLGQTSASYDYIVRADDLTALTASAHVDLVLTEKLAAPAAEPQALEFVQTEKPALRAARIRLQFVGANEQATVGDVSPLGASSNYFKGPEDQWVSNVPHYSNVRYENVYPGIDVVYKLSAGKFEYDFVVSPGADSSQIALRLDGIKSAVINQEGLLEANTPVGILTQSIPAVYQVVDGDKTLIDGKFSVNENGDIGFSVASHVDDRTVVIDPLIEFSGYFGGTRSDGGLKMQEKPNGNLVLLGSTTSQLESITNPSELAVSADVFLAEIDRTSGDILWVTVLGGNRNDASENFRIDSAGNSIVVGYTQSADYPTFNAFQPDFVGNNTTDNSILNTDGFVTKVSADGASLVFSTYLGGNDVDIDDPNVAFGFELFRGIDIDDQDNIFIVGQTAAPDFPVTTTFNGFECFEQDLDPAIQSGGNSSDITFSEFSPTGALVFSTCIGGSARDAGRSVIVQSDGSVVIAGFTRSFNFPVTAGAFQSSPLEPFEVTPLVLKLAPDYSQITMATLVGEGFLQTVDIDGAGDIYGVSSSRGLNTATPGAFQETSSDTIDSFQPSEGYVFKLSADGTTLLYGTYLGSLGVDSIVGIRVDDEGRAYVAGSSSAVMYPLKNPLALPEAAILRNSDLGVSSSGFNHIARDFLTSTETVVSLLSRNGTNRYAFGDTESVGQIVPFFPDGNYDTAAMALAQTNANPATLAYAAVANRNGPNQLYAFDSQSFVFTEFVSSTDLGDDTRAVEANFITNIGGTANFYFGNYGGLNTVARFNNVGTILTTENTGRSDGNTTALAQVIISDQGVLENYIAVANEFQDIRLYNATSTTLGPAIILDIDVGGVTDLVSSDINGDGISELLIVSSDRPVELVWFGDAGAIANVDLLTGADSDNLSAVAADVDDDNDQDIIVGRQGDDKLFLNNLGTFTLDPNYTGNTQATKSLVAALPLPTPPVCPCFGIVDENPQELLGAEGNRAVLSVLSADGSDLEFSTFLGSGGTESIFRGLAFANGSDSKVLLAATVSGDEWPLVTSSLGRSEATDAAYMVLELDQDGDNALDTNDNCTLVANSDQNDTDADGYGNACDADFNNDCTVNFLDIAAFADEFLGTNPLFDINGDGAVNFLDFSAVSTQFLNPPGPGLGDCEIAPH